MPTRRAEPQVRETAAEPAASREDLSVLDVLPRLVREHVLASRAGDVPVVEQHDAAGLRRVLDLSLPREGLSDRELVPILESYLRHAVRTAHPQFHNQLFSGFSLPAFLGEVVASAANTTMSTFEASPVATLMERTLLSRMRALVGWPGGEGDGILCTGGSNANLLGMLCARERAFPSAGHEGFAAGVVPQAFVSDQAHYSYAKAAKLLGVGTANLVEVPSDARGRMDPAALERAVARSREQGHAPFFVGATVGTTVLGAFDPLRALAAVAARHGLWLHADGSWGGSVLLSERHRDLLDGSELCDSFAWDSHKMLGATLPCSAFLTRHAGALGGACAAENGDTEYLLHDSPDAELDFGRSSLQCGRRVDALKLWLLWRRHGEAGLSARVDHLFDLADHARELVERHERLELLAPVESLNVCFRWRPRAGDPDRFNVALRERLRESGRAFVNYARAGGALALRLVLSNADLERAHVERFFEHVAEAAGALE